MATQPKKFNIVIEKTFIYPLQVEAMTKKEAKQIAEKYKTKKSFWKLRDTEYLHEEKYRTERQNNALHLYFSQIAKALNDNDITMNETLSKFTDFDIFPSMESIKELWRNIQLKLFGFKSTRRLKKDEQIKQIHDPINKVLAENYGIHVPFPSRETLHYEKMSKEYSER
ncbi:MAG: hypothetical protein KAS32_00245 [Candidatus Peribacteraceae bacterium]|nr:hypothetical protein [Candidatus Peribacteraceae bacterium]